MAQDLVDRFMQALQEMEQTGEVDTLADLFAEDATLRKPAVDETQRGREGARRFWRGYLEAFREVRSEFTEVTRADGRAVLEWASEGSLPDGRPIRYEGVSMLELSGDRVTAFRTYYDSAAFLGPGGKGQAS